MLFKWIPWKYLLRRTARKYKILDPITLLAQLRRFAQPSEVQEPIELLRAGIVFHARGLINTKAIQYNLDWIWPYWVEKQFNPKDASFIPRGFSFSHVNLTHRNWTAVGHPDISLYPIIDPRGLATPVFDGWSLDFWIITEAGNHLFPSRLSQVDQKLLITENLSVQTICRKQNLLLETVAALELHENRPQLNISIKGAARQGGWVAVGLRPYNPEGIQFIEKIAYIPSERRFLVNTDIPIRMSEQPEKVVFSDYREGDVVHRLNASESRRSVECNIGMATAAALFKISHQQPKGLQIGIPLDDVANQTPTSFKPPARDWHDCLADKSSLDIPDERIRFLFDASLRTLVLLSADDVVPGPYTYRRFWFRDACFMINALLTAGFLERCYRKLETFSQRQKRSGYFQSQEGEWDSNGQVIWILHRYQQIADRPLHEHLVKAALKGARWIANKRIRTTDHELHAGLLPAGFSAEHLGPNDYYYWDNFWGLAGLKAAAAIAKNAAPPSLAAKLEKQALDYEKRIFQTIDEILQRRKIKGIPASCYRRLDAGAVGSLVADYPLQITPPRDPLILNTVEFLMKNCFQNGAFFQDMIHSGINAYLTLSIAQTLLRSQDPRYRRLLKATVDLAASTGNWPEAIHPHTGGGCMGDGHHGWAAAEWFMMIRNLFVREEGESVILGTGIFPEWLQTGKPIRFGPTWTPKGRISFSARQADNRIHLSIDAKPKDDKFDMRVEIPGYKKQTVASHNKNIIIEVDQS